MKKFDLEKALSGEPVLLLGGDIGLVRYQEKELEVSHVLFGYHEDDEGDVYPIAWSIDGKVEPSPFSSAQDIIGMYPKEEK